MRRLLVIEQAGEHARRYVVERLVALGYRLVLLTEIPPFWGEGLYEEVIVSRLASWPRIEHETRLAHARDPFHGVLTYNDGATPLANRIAGLLGLPRLSRHHGDAYRFKDRMRIAWEACGIPTPRYQLLHRRRDLYALQSWRYPIVLKPANLMGSIGVVRVDSFDELTRKIGIPFSADLDIVVHGEVVSLRDLYGLPSVVLAEEYVVGPEYSAEGVVVDGRYVLVGLTKKYQIDEPFFDETGHLVPARDVSPVDRAAVLTVLDAAHRALGLLNTVTHTEFRMSDGRPVLMEVNPRLAGDHIPCLVERALGIDPVALAAGAACGSLAADELERSCTTPAAAEGPVEGVCFVSSPASGYGRRFSGISFHQCRDVSVHETATYLEHGELIERPETWGDTRVGHVLFLAASLAAGERFVASGGGIVAHD